MTHSVQPPSFRNHEAKSEIDWGKSWQPNINYLLNNTKENINKQTPLEPNWSVHTNYAIGVPVAGILVMCVLIMIITKICKKGQLGYTKLFQERTKGFDYIYKPLMGAGLDDEYENTFVGVSVPLLQEVSEV